jgi:hypothetical protein
MLRPPFLDGYPSWQILASHKLKGQLQLAVLLKSQG